jgi:hypothetical protein
MSESSHLAGVTTWTIVCIFAGIFVGCCDGLGWRIH